MRINVKYQNLKFPDESDRLFHTHGDYIADDFDIEVIRTDDDQIQIDFKFEDSSRQAGGTVFIPADCGSWLAYALLSASGRFGTPPFNLTFSDGQIQMPKAE
jgi:hypothetical protein